MSRPKLEAFGSPLCYRPSSLTKCFSVSVFCRDQGIWAQTDLPEVYQNPLEERSLAVVSGTSAIELLPLLFLLFFFICLCCCGGQQGSTDNETKSQPDFNSSNPGMDFSEENPDDVSVHLPPEEDRQRDMQVSLPTSPDPSPGPSPGAHPSLCVSQVTPRNAHGALLSPPLSRTRIPSWRVRFHSHLAALRTPQYSPAWTRLHFIQRAELELAVCPPWRKGPLRSVRTLLPLLHLGSPSPHFGAPRRLKNTEALSVVEKFWDMRDGTFPAISVNKGYHSHGR
ncbi:uncharacterized protein [Bos taurus]|uniref:uncharacterized protein isoform X3 n=1 Tax=Bos taurus TaxID=9913 RepID=UPI0028CBC009|nr:uncharacterized protein LOC100848752 isoform X3 [Bos taurus]